MSDIIIKDVAGFEGVNFTFTSPALNFIPTKPFPDDAFKDGEISITEIGASASVGSVADSYDNAMAEALNGTFKAELIEMQGPWKDVDQVERAIFQWVTWYNDERLHSALDYVPPAEYERDWWRQQEATPQSA